MPTQEEKALMRYESLKLQIQKESPVSADLLFASMFDTYGILERTTGRYLKYLKLLGFVKIEGTLVSWIDQSNKT